MEGSDDDGTSSSDVDNYKDDPTWIPNSEDYGSDYEGERSGDGGQSRRFQRALRGN